MSKFITLKQSEGKHQAIINTEDVSNITRYGQHIYVNFLSGQEQIAIKINDGEEKQVMQDLFRALREG